MQAQCSFKLDLTKVPVIADVATKMGPFPLPSQGRYTRRQIPFTVQVLLFFVVVTQLLI